MIGLIARALRDRQDNTLCATQYSATNIAERNRPISTRKPRITQILSDSNRIAERMFVERVTNVADSASSSTVHSVR